uniref:Uncharacterized protein n=1 Tax=Panagrolaimus sp. PS1159 TaxID=55785 RepID=A0AC35F5S4_9BILA
MATKSDKFPFNEQSSTTSKNQYYNLNLKESEKCATLISVQSNSKPINDKYCASNNCEKKEIFHLWNKSSKVSTFKTLNEENNGLKKRWKNENTLNAMNKSTLSLHIAAYENPITSDLFGNESNAGLKKETSIKKRYFIDSFKSRNPLEFTRQQNGDQKTEPEVSQFKASQKLLDSKQPSSKTSPLVIDIAFKWNKSKPEGEKKEEDKPKNGSESDETETETTCSTVTKTETTTTQTFGDTNESDPNKSGNTKYDSIKTGSEEWFEAESTQPNSASSPSENKQMKTAKSKARIESNSEASTKSSESESEIATAPTQASKNEESKKTELKLKTAEEKVKPDSDQKPFNQRRVIMFRHAERMDRVFPSWIRQSNSNGSYRPYNSNQPSKLPKRQNGLSAYDSDPPITEIGKIVAELSGKSLMKSHTKISAIYSSPAFRCIETAQIIAKESGATDLKIKVENGLFDWCSFYEIPPTFMTTSELLDAGYSISKNYRSIISKETLYKEWDSETKYDYYRRSHDVIHKILTSTIGTVIIIGHATTIDSTSRALLELSKSIPSTHILDRLADRYPYCTSILLEQSNQNGQWRIGKSLLPITFLNQTTKYDKQFLLRK